MGISTHSLCYCTKYFKAEEAHRKIRCSSVKHPPFCKQPCGVHIQTSKLPVCHKSTMNPIIDLATHSTLCLAYIFQTLNVSITSITLRPVANLLVINCSSGMLLGGRSSKPFLTANLAATLENQIAKLILLRNRFLH